MHPKGSVPADRHSSECAEIHGPQRAAQQIPVQTADLAPAFTQFMTASSRMKQKYQELQQELGYSGSGKSGLGLAVCERILQLHGGSIAVVNGVGEGARFRLEFSLLKMECANV